MKIGHMNENLVMWINIRFNWWKYCQINTNLLKWIKIYSHKYKFEKKRKFILNY